MKKEFIKIAEDLELSRTIEKELTHDSSMFEGNMYNKRIVFMLNGRLWVASFDCTTKLYVYNISQQMYEQEHNIILKQMEKIMQRNPEFGYEYHTCKSNVTFKFYRKDVYYIYDTCGYKDDCAYDLDKAIMLCNYNPLGAYVTDEAGNTLYEKCLD